MLCWIWGLGQIVSSIFFLNTSCFLGCLLNCMERLDERQNIQALGKEFRKVEGNSETLNGGTRMWGIESGSSCWQKEQLEGSWLEKRYKWVSLVWPIQRLVRIVSRYLGISSTGGDGLWFDREEFRLGDERLFLLPPIENQIAVKIFYVGERQIRIYNEFVVESWQQHQPFHIPTWILWLERELDNRITEIRVLNK